MLEVTLRTLIGLTQKLRSELLQSGGTVGKPGINSKGTPSWTSYVNLLRNLLENQSRELSSDILASDAPAAKSRSATSPARRLLCRS